MKERKVAGPLKDLSRQSACQANQIAADIYSAAYTHYSQSMLRHLENGEYREIVSASIDPKAYGSNADMFRRDYLCAELMSKFPCWDIGIDRAQVALSKFCEVELALTDLEFTENPILHTAKKAVRMRAIEMTARKKIEKILGELDVNEVYRSFAFGPGASTSQPRRRGDAAYKFGAIRPHMSYNALPLVDALSKMHPTWRFNAEVVGGSRLVTVPKNAKTDRTICIEPDLNMYLQKGIGSTIRRRLRRWGLLSNTAQQYNAELAREGSATGRLATVDLSSASDSIHLGLVDALLPPQWVDLIELTRSPTVILPGGEIRLLRKVSSMGNGFTFELETLIFYGLCSAVIDLCATKDMDHRCTVFGDDIIIATELVGPLEEVLRYFGFTMNSKKTFSDGPFRESCGKHYFNGIDVTPFYIRSPVDTVLRQYWAANTVRRYSRFEQWGLDPRWQGCYNNIVQSIPEKYRRVMIPDGFGDGGLIVDWDEARPSRSTRGYDSWSYRDIVPRVKDKKLEGHGVLLKALHSLEISSDRPDVDAGRGEIDRMIGVALGFSQAIRDNARHGSSPMDEHLDGLLGAFLQQCGLGDALPSVIPVNLGYKYHVGHAQRWPSYGTWL